MQSKSKEDTRIDSDEQIGVSLILTAHVCPS